MNKYIKKSVGKEEQNILLDLSAKCNSSLIKYQVLFPQIILFSLIHQSSNNNILFLITLIFCIISIIISVLSIILNKIAIDKKVSASNSFQKYELIKLLIAMKLNITK